MINLNRGPSRDASYHGFGSFGWTVSEEKIFLEIDQPETRIAYDCHVC
jgi:hypothetical protein